MVILKAAGFMRRVNFAEAQVDVGRSVALALLLELGAGIDGEPEAVEHG
ncbi:hypothetical protein [Edaphobacter aggregans]|nr:hypothetical protein [Edaphobacter aggregans]